MTHSATSLNLQALHYFQLFMRFNVRRWSEHNSCKNFYVKIPFFQAAAQRLNSDHIVPLDTPDVRLIKDSHRNKTSALDFSEKGQNKLHKANNIVSVNENIHSRSINLLLSSWDFSLVNLLQSKSLWAEERQDGLRAAAVFSVNQNFSHTRIYTKFIWQQNLKQYCCNQ